MQNKFLPCLFVKVFPKTFQLMNNKLFAIHMQMTTIISSVETTRIILSHLSLANAIQIQRNCTNWIFRNKLLNINHTTDILLSSWRSQLTLTYFPVLIIIFALFDDKLTYMVVYNNWNVLYFFHYFSLPPAEALSAQACWASIYPYFILLLKICQYHTLLIITFS